MWAATQSSTHGDLKKSVHILLCTCQTSPANKQHLIIINCALVKAALLISSKHYPTRWSGCKEVPSKEVEMNIFGHFLSQPPLEYLCQGPTFQSSLLILCQDCCMWVWVYLHWYSVFLFFTNARLQACLPNRVKGLEEAAAHLSDASTTSIAICGGGPGATQSSWCAPQKYPQFSLFQRCW